MYARDTVKKLLKWSLCDLMKAFIGDMRAREQTEASGRAQGQGIRLNMASRQDQTVCERGGWRGENRQDTVRREQECLGGGSPGEAACYHGL